ncbi:hypothetical protein AAH991_38290 [Microbispora sp. ZYX-F-249]|uniref:Uncharacterized protein n=1 Tax=Microbispora maris TaxID=3144104 RepID=A0ABV0B1R7_9ACTN
MRVEMEMSAVDRFSDLLGAISQLEATEPGRTALEALASYESCG